MEVRVPPISVPCWISILHLHKQIFVAASDWISVVNLIDSDGFLKTAHHDLTNEIEWEGWHGKFLDVVHVSAEIEKIVIRVIQIIRDDFYQFSPPLS